MPQAMINVPPELFRPIIRHILLTSNLRQSIHMRRVSRSFDAEILSAIEDHDLLRDDPPYGELRETGIHGSEFMATYLLSRPHKQQPWSANISALFNTLVDDLSTQQHLPIESPCRRDLLLALCKSVRQQNKNHFLVPDLYPVEGSPHPIFDPDYSYDQKLLCARLITGNFELNSRDSRILIDSKARMLPDTLGSLVNAAIWGRQYDILRYIFLRGQDGHDPRLRPQHPMHRALKAAVMMGDLEVVKLILDPQWGHDRYGRIIEVAIDLCVVFERDDIKQYLQSLLEEASL